MSRLVANILIITAAKAQCDKEKRRILFCLAPASQIKHGPMFELKL